MPAPNYIAPRSIGFEAHLRDWDAKAERRFEAKQLTGAARMEAGGADVEFAFFDIIGSWWADERITGAKVRSELAKHPNAKKIRVLINSPGGVCSEGVTIYNLLRMHPAEVEVVVVGEAASAASVIAMAGDRIIMRTGTWMMVHRAACCVCGFDSDMLEAASYLKTVTEGAVDIYAKRTGGDRAELVGMVEATTWMGAQTAVDLGFADAVDESEVEPLPSGDEDQPDEVNVNVRISTQQTEKPRLLSALSALNQTRPRALLR